MADPTSYPISFASKGIFQKSAPDEIPISGYKALDNLYVDIEGALTVRKGRTRLNSGLGGVPHAFAYLKDDSGNAWRYAIVGRELYVGSAAVPGGSMSQVTDGSSSLKNTTDPISFFDSYTLRGAVMKPHIFLADGAVFLKHPGNTSNSARRVGIPAPTAPTVAAASSTVIENFQDYAAAPAFTTSTTGGAVTLANVAGGVTGGAMSFAVAAPGGIGYALRTYGSTKDLDNSDLTGSIQIYIKFPTQTDQDNCQEIRVLLDIDPVTPGATVYRTIISIADVTWANNTWGSITVRKSDFFRDGTTEADHPEYNWGTVKGIQLQLHCSDACTVYLDSLQLLGPLLSDDLQWAITYYDSQLDTESDLSPVATLSGAMTGAVTVTMPTRPATTAPAAVPDRINVYRMGGTITQFQYVGYVAYSVGAGALTFTDNVPDSELGDVADLDNQLPATAPLGVVLADNRLWTWGGTYGGITEPTNRLKFSKNVNVEEWPADNYVYVGSGSEAIQRAVEYDGELFVFTLSKVYRITGGNGQYRAVDTPILQGLKVPQGVCRGLHSLYFYSFDGLYEFPSGKKITEPINNAFHGLTLDSGTISAIPPVYSGEEHRCAMEYWDNRLYFAYSSAASTANANMLVYDVIYDRWTYYEYGSFALFAEPDNNILIGAMTECGSYPMQLESGFADVLSGSTAGIFWGLHTKDFDLGVADEEKRFVDMVVDCDTQSQDASISLAYDAPIIGSPSFTSIGTVNTNGRDQKVLPIESAGDSRLARRIMLQMTGTTAAGASAATRLYKVVFRTLPDAPKHSTFVTGWSDQGIPGTKIFRELHIDMDTLGAALTSIQIQVDGTSPAGGLINASNGYTMSTSGRQKKIFPLYAYDVKGILARLKITCSGSNLVKVFEWKLVSYQESDAVNQFQTVWSDDGAPGQRKRFRKLLIEAENLSSTGGTVDVVAQIDGAAVTITPSTISAQYRQQFAFSFNVDQVGTVWRTELTASTGNSFRFYRAWVEAIPEPFQEYRYESPWQDIGGKVGRKRVRSLVIDADTGGNNVTVTVWIDGSALGTTYTINMSTRQNTSFSLPVDTAGRIGRVTATASTPFTIYSAQLAGFDDAWEDTIIETPWSDDGAPNQKKRFRKLMVEVDNLGTGTTGTIAVVMQVDNASVTITPSLITQAQTGRKEYVFSPEVDTVGALWRSTLTASSGNSMRFYRAWVEAIPEPFSEMRYESPWANIGGNIGRRRVRDLVVVADTGGSDVTVTVWVDGAALAGTFTLNTTGRQEKIFSLPVDTAGKIGRITATSGGGGGSSAFTIYDFTFKGFDDAWEDTIIETPWSDEGAPNLKKRFRKLLVEVDNLAAGTNGSIAVVMQVDGSSVTITPSTITSAQTGRKEYVFSLNADTVGALWRATLTAATDNSMRFYRAWVEAIPEPFSEVRYESPWDDSGAGGYKHYRELIVEIDTGGAAVTITPWVDGVSLTPFTLTTSARLRTVTSLPIDTKGKLSRITATCATAFTVYGVSFTQFDDALENTIIETPWNDSGAPNQRKRFRKFICELENLGTGTITILCQVDNSTVLTFTSTGAGRKEVTGSCPVDTVGILWRTTATVSSGSFRFHRSWVEAIPEPFQGAVYESPWNDDGSPGLKRYRDLLIDADTGGGNVTVTVWVDGAALAGTFTLNTTGRQTKVLPLPLDTLGKLTRVTATGAAVFTIYKHSITSVAEPVDSTIAESPWTTEGWPYKKLWKEMTLEVDTGGVAATATLWIDGTSSSQQFTVQTNSRRPVTFSVAKDTIGKIARTTLAGPTAKVYGVQYVTEKLPPDVTLADSYEQSLSFDRQKTLGRRLWLSVKNPATVTVQIYIDGVLAYTPPAMAISNPSSGYLKRSIDLVPGLKGKLVRLVLTSASGFQVWWQDSEVEVHDMNTEDGYRRHKFPPPQTY